MKPLKTNQEIQHFSQEEGFRLVYFASEACSVCRQMREEVITRYRDRKNMELGLVMIEDVPEARGAYQVFTAPTLHMYFGGQKIYEAGRFLHLEELDAKIQRIEELQTM